MIDLNPNIILNTKGLTVNFGSFCALDSVDISIKKGSITGLIGPNGAGKSTLFNALTGTLKPSNGNVFLGGKKITGNSPDKLFVAGLGRTFQTPRPFKKMSVLENVMLAPMNQLGENIFSPLFNPKQVVAQELEIRSRALEILDFVTLLKLADHDAGEISGGQMKLLDLARILMGNPSVILLDEPAAGVNPSLTRILLERIEELNKQGKTFLIIEHDMDFIMSHCEPIIALSAGKVVFEGTAKEAQANTILLDAYLGVQEDE
jgi:branched-chain amino acid transport system ATP-binding protein